jgi:hypothetical protein
MYLSINTHYVHNALLSYRGLRKRAAAGLCGAPVAIFFKELHNQNNSQISSYMIAAEIKLAGAFRTVRPLRPQGALVRCGVSRRGLHRAVGVDGVGEPDPDRRLICAREAKILVV